MANTYLTRTISSGGADLTKWTWSCWVKRTDLVGGGNNYQRLISNEVNGNAKSWYIRFQNSTQFHAWSNNGAFEFTTNGKYRDINGWYHLVVKYDSTQSTEADRFKVYVNGEEPSMSAIHYPTLNETVNFMNTGNYIDIGYYRQGSSEYFYGLMSHMHFTAGYAYDASAFGSTDSTTGEWQINTSPSVTYGSLGFFILKDGNSVTDQSPNTNNFTVGGGTLTKTEDCPSNVFNTLNPLENYYSNYTYAQGNTAVSSTSSDRTYVTSTLGMPSGKYYWECKLDATIGDSGGASTSVYVGITGQSPISPSQFPSDGTCFNCVMNTNGQVYSNGSTIGSAMGSSWATSTFVMMAYDADNNKMYFGKDGVWLNSGDPTSGATGTGAFTPTTAASATPIGVYMPQWGVDYNASYGTSFNFGNGYFGTTAVSSAGTNASGNGIFEYDVPSGYTALSTKGLNL